jgi:peptidoglycan/xylan/chitin deacetylase (PgdA/CDA1 family)
MMENQTRGTVIISYDDGVTEDYTLAFPVHRKYGVPAEVCMPSGYVGRYGRVTKSHLLEFESSGWEIVSHTKHHISLADEALAKSARRGDVKLYISKHTRFKPGVQLSISQGELSELVTVSGYGTDTFGNYLQIDKELENNYTNIKSSRGYRILASLLRQKPLEALVSISDDQTYTEIESSKSELESMGLQIRHFTYPYNRYSRRTKEIVSRFYDSARAGSNGNSTSPIPDRYALRSFNFERHKLTDENLMRILEKTEQRDELCFLHAHSRNNEYSVERLEKIITTCLTKRIRISTRSEYFSK